ncbi:MAG: MBL fold metallo-hydrolase [Myxococcales bacterium]|nr:MBL fold metallo-hydrolase [Myxococcales bacterium]
MTSLIVVSLIVAACSSSASKAKPPVESAGRAARIAIGTVEAYAVADGHLQGPNDGTTFGIGQPTGATTDILAAAGLPTDTIRLDVQCLLVKSGDRVILFDTGLGSFADGNTGHLPESLALAGVQPGAVTDVFISHAHTDHVGGLVTKTGALAFPAATIHLSAPEWASLQADQDKDAQALVHAIASKVAAFEPDTQVLPGVKAVDTRGHTPGHSSYLVGSGADAVFYLGDLAHHHVISVQRPAWSIQFDADRAAAGTMRQQTLAALAASGTRVFAVHFPFPGVGHVAADGAGLVWTPAAP